LPPLRSSGRENSGGGHGHPAVLSSAAWINVPTGYAASKAALWSATNPWLDDQLATFAP
jgi:hypothetical protein